MRGRVYQGLTLALFSSHLHQIARLMPSVRSESSRGYDYCGTNYRAQAEARLQSLQQQRSQRAARLSSLQSARSQTLNALNQAKTALQNTQKALVTARAQKKDLEGKLADNHKQQDARGKERDSNRGELRRVTAEIARCDAKVGG